MSETASSNACVKATRMLFSAWFGNSKLTNRLTGLPGVSHTMVARTIGTSLFKAKSMYLLSLVSLGDAKYSSSQTRSTKLLDMLSVKRVVRT